LAGALPLSTRIEKTKPLMRKQPRQSRSKATVDAIVEAAARILGDQGWSGFTTNKVAEVAGVSIGSYYQYFPGKHSLIEAIRGRHLEDCRLVMKNAVERDCGLLLFVTALVDDIIAIHMTNPGLHRILLDEALSSEEFRDPHSDFEREYLGYYEAVVAKFRQDHGPESASMGHRTVGIIISDAVDGIVHNAARRGTLQSPEIRTGLVRVITSYLAAA
jgi:AcrR family transcriptional regulator